MEKNFTEYELKELSNITINKLKLKRNRTIFSTIALLVLLVGSVGASRLIGVDQSKIEAMAQGIMIANGVVANGGILLAFMDNMAIKSFKKGIAKLEAGEIDEESYYNTWLKEAWNFANINYEKIVKELNDGMGYRLR